MQNTEKEYTMGELHEMLNKLYKEADKLTEQIDSIKKKGAFTLRQAEAVLSENMREQIRHLAKTNLLQLVERLVEMNCHLELADDESPSLTIPYPPVGCSSLKLRFLTGDTPWNFWLSDEQVDVKTLHKNLLKKYQNDLLEPLPNPKSQESVCFLDRNKVLRGIVLQAFHGNRVKVLDCDSNISKVITSDKVFKADPDACCIHASTIKCTIQKESVNTDVWNADLRDVFCNVLKEAVLNVKIVDRLAGSFPSFLVDVELRNEEEDCNGHLKEWILDRLLPELRKLTVDENESICDFLSSDALNPYYKDNTELRKTFKGANGLTNIPESRGSLSEEDNNLNSDSEKVPVKCFPNIDYMEDEKTDSESIVVSSSSEEGIAMSSDSGPEVPVTSTTSEASFQKMLNKTTNQSSELKPEIFIPPKINQVPTLLYNYQPLPPHYSQPYRYSNPQYNPVPFIPLQYPHNPPSHHTPLWNFQGPPLRQAPYQYRSVVPQPPAAAPVNSGNVNVMAPEFVPKTNNNANEKSQITFTKDGLQNSASPVTSEVVHLELRRPSSLLKPGENLMVGISHVVSPAEFYIHFLSNNNKYLDKLKDSMFTYYNTTKKVNYKSWQEAKRAQGEFCACKWLEDNHWYRAQVIEWAPIDNCVRVNFVDYGNIEIVPLNCIQPLTQPFTTLSMCAQPCHLAKVLPSVRHQPWSEEATQFFKSRVEVSDCRFYSVTVVPTKQNEAQNNSLSVLLYEGKATENFKSINEEMVECGLAWSKHFSTQFRSSGNGPYQSLDELSSSINDSDSDKQYQTNHVVQQSSVELEPEWDGWDPMAEEYKSVRNNPARDTDDASVAVVGYSAKDEARICQFYARDGFCRKPLCTKEHIKPRSDGVTTDKEEVFCRAFSEMELPSVGDHIDVLVTAVASIKLFYVQLPQNRGVEDEEDTLTSLAYYMNLPENIMKMKFLKVPPAVGQLVLAKWDDQWYRARVVSCDDDILEVMFVDYGSLSSVSEVDLREMEPQYLHLPFQAIECSLANIIPPDHTSSNYEKATETLRELTEGKQFNAVVFDSFSGESYNEMEIFLKNEEGDIGDRLIESGLATKRDLDWYRALNPNNLIWK